MRVAFIATALIHVRSLSGVAAELESRITATSDTLIDGQPFFLFR
jgi:hypothetical protein